MTNFEESNSSFYDHEYFLGMEWRYFSGAHANKVKLFLNFIGKVEGKRVLDIGCGSGLFSYSLKEKGAHVVGGDYSSEAITFARSRYPGIDFKVGSVYDLSNWPDEHFDIVSVMDVIEHLSDQSAALQQIKRVLKPGGLLVISTDLKDTHWENGIFNRFFWFSMRFSKEGRAYRLIKLTESRIPAKKHYQSSHIGLLSFRDLENLIEESGLGIIRHEVYPLVSVWWRDLLFKVFPKRARGEHQMLLASKS